MILSIVQNINLFISFPCQKSVGMGSLFVMIEQRVYIKLLLCLQRKSGEMVNECRQIPSVFFSVFFCRAFDYLLILELRGERCLILVWF
jgi:hypothetical protein